MAVHQPPLPLTTTTLLQVVVASLRVHGKYSSIEAVSFFQLFGIKVRMANIGFP
jgi:hypothetical protein